jgi:hypothetical protein
MAISIFGVVKEPVKIIWNEQDLSEDKWTFDTITNILKLTTLTLDLSKTHKFVFFKFYFSVFLFI